MSDTKSRSGTPNNRAEPSRFLLKAKVLDYATFKTNKYQQWVDENCSGHSRRPYGGVSRLANQPQEGSRWQAQDQIMNTVQATHRPVIKNAQVHGPG